MANIYTSADQLIGKTPLLELTHIEKALGLKAKVLAKLEYFNPAGSVKDRVAKAMIDDAEEKGLLKPGSVIIEPYLMQLGFISRTPRGRCATELAYKHLGLVRDGQQRLD